MIQRETFPITLVFPPQGHFTQPYLALPCLKAWLHARGFADVEMVDASIDAYDHFLARDVLARCAERASRRVPLARFAGDELAFRDMAAFRAAAESAVSAEALVDEIDGAKAVLRGEACFDPERYVPAVRTIYHALRLVSAAHHPTQWTPHNFTMRYGIDRSSHVLAATLDEDENPFLAYFRESLLPALVARRPRVLGMSVIYGSQLIPALTLGRLVKRALPDCHVTAGGGFLAYVGAKLMRAPGMDACLDSLIFHEGEAPLAGVCSALREGRSLDGVGSLTWFDRSGGVARPVENAPGHPIHLDEAPVPDFDGLPLEKYFSPAIVIPYDINRGCYYGECTFCTLPTVIGPGYRTRSAKTIVGQVLELCERHGTRNVNFITDCMPPGMIKDLPDELLARDARIHWWCDARVEPKAYTVEGARRLYEAGCRKLLFGFETATPRLLKMMKKGQSLKSTVDVARNCTQAGISVTFYAMVGFPTETKEEAQATLDFLIEHSDVVREVSLQTFHIDEVAQTYREPEAFGITILDDPSLDIELYHDYECDRGMTQREAAEMFERMMTGLRAHLPIFSGDNIFYFMQKSHYFLHLARGMKPAEFVDRCRARTQSRAARGAERGLRVRSGARFVDLAFGYGDALAKLAHPLARMASPESLSGRFVAGADEEAQRALGSIRARPSVLAYEPKSAEFVELRPDGRKALEALSRRADLGALLDEIERTDRGAGARFAEFAAELHRVGLLAPETRGEGTKVRVR